MPSRAVHMSSHRSSRCDCTRISNRRVYGRLSPAAYNKQNRAARIARMNTHQDLQKINERLIKALHSYAADYKNKSMTDEKKLTDEYLSIEQAEVKLKSSYVPKRSKALPATKVARYLQIENKIRAVIKYDLAATVPLVQ
jgi:hypothetical protein